MTSRPAAATYSLATLMGFRGPIGRRQFLVSLVIQLLLLGFLTGALLLFMGGDLLTGMMDHMMAGSGVDAGIKSTVIVFTVVAAGLEFVISILTFTSMRARLHDLELSTWWTIPISVPAVIGAIGVYYAGDAGEVMQTIGIDVTGIFLILMLCWPGQRQNNPFAPRCAD